MSENTSRREFLKLAGKGVLGAAALSTVPAMLPAAWKRRPGRGRTRSWTRTRL